MDNAPLKREKAESETAVKKRGRINIKTIVRSPSFWIIAIIIVYMAFVSSYNDFKQPEFSVIVRDTTEALDTYQEGRTFNELKQSYRYALLSAEVYDKKKKLCEPAQSTNGAPLSPWTLKDHWKELKPSELPGLPKKPKSAADWYGNFATGLKFKILYKNVSDEKTEADTSGTDKSKPRILVAIVFRGTDDRYSDVWSNLHWLTRWIPFTYDQYDMVRAIAPELVDGIKKYENFKGADIRIITAGHSLGGGLAQQAAYAADNIKTVYTFDSSSVTGFYDVGKQDRNRRAKGMRIYRIYERGEILAYLRRFMAQIYPVVANNPKIVEARYNFQNLKGNFIALHNMEKLACNLRIVSLRRPREEKETQTNN